MPNVAEIKRHADIRQVWAALGGGKLRGLRGQAFWRNGDGYNVLLDTQRGTWHDFVSDDGGDVVELVRTVQRCGFKDAAEWLARHTGVPVSKIREDSRIDIDWPTDLKWATWWSLSAETLAEEALESLPYWHPERRGITVFLSTIRLGDAALVDEYREWRRRFPDFTAAMAHAGRRSDARIQRRLAHWIRRTYGHAIS